MATLTQILKGQGSTPIVKNHLQQQQAFICGGGSGVEFLPLLDEGNIRKSFIDGVVKVNRLKVRARRLAVKLPKRGKFLLYLRPVGKGYKIHNYDPEQYRTEFDEYGDLSQVTIIYGYKRKVANTPQLQKRWVKLRITQSVIEKIDSDQELDFDTESHTLINTIPTLIENRFGFIPCVEVLNPIPGSEDEGQSDFEEAKGFIEAHDDLTEAAIDNLYYFANSPLVTSKDAGDVSESLGLGRPVPGFDRLSQGDSSSYASGYRENFPTPYPTETRRARLKKLKRVIGDFEDGETLQQLQINAVGADQLGFIDAYERQIRELLGGRLERGLETATETNTIFGIVQATAGDKQQALFTYGICALLEMAIQAEEMLYVASLGKEGLPPLGDRTIVWRIGEVFKESPESVNFRSITARNLSKFFGWSPKAATQYVFPNRSEAELDQAIGTDGFPSDYLQTALALYAQLQQPNLLTNLPPLDPQTGLPLADKLLDRISRQLDFGNEFATVTPDTREDPLKQLQALQAALSYLRNAALDQKLGTTAMTGDESLPSPGSTVQAPPSTNPFLDFSRSPILNGVRSLFS